MRKIRYQVACSLDGYIAGPDDEYDWIVADPDIDFEALFDEFDTLLMGRRTFEVAGAELSQGMKTLVFSRSLRPEDHPGVTIISEQVKETLDSLRAQQGKDIWLFGGGELFRSLLELGCVDTVEPAVIPVVLGGGRPFLPGPALRRRLSLTETRVYEKSGIVLLKYDVVPEKTKTKSGKRKTSGR
ncbi:MAG TPA: dihydrofolate reductase family protein [Pyrinomonadaceae bacterium]|nr:dihydrofolate reductase family protein [Pyrinomonadaceae bacterium]